MKKITWIALLALGFLAASILSGCGGGMSTPLLPPISVSVNPTTASVQVSQTASFMATVQNDSANKGVTWSLSGAGCSGATCGALSANSSASGAPITYTAPSTVPTPATVTLTASSVTDHNKSAAATITIAPPPPSISTKFLPDGMFGTPYHQTIQATGGVAPFSWAVSAGAFPSGLKSDNSPTSTVTISGTPDMVQMGVQFTITVTDSVNQSAMQPYTVNIKNPPALTIGTTSVPSGTVNVAYSFTFSAAGGSPPYTWSETGALPAGLSFGTNGTLSGRATAAGSFPIMVTVTDSLGQTNTQPFTIVVYLASSVLSGRYVFQFQGFNSSGALVAAVGSFLADAFGAVSNATVDTNGVGGPLASNLALTGTYSFDANNLGTMTLTGPQGNATLRFALYPNPNGSNISSGGSIIDFNGVKNGAGSISTQDPMAFSASKITGFYVFSFTGGNASGRAAVAGRLTADGVGLGGPNSLNSGAMDVNESGTVFSNAMFTGNYDVPAGSTNGRGTAMLNTTLGGNPVAFSFTFYIQDATALLFLGSDPVSATLPLLSGSMIPQAPMAYSNSTLNFTSVLATTGLASAGPDITSGLFTVTPSSGNYGFTYDENSGGTIPSSKQVTGAYAVDPSGRVTVTGITHPPVFYLSGLNSGYVLGTDANVASGTLIALVPPTSLQGTLAVKTGAPVTANQENDFGKLTFSNNSVSGRVNIGSPSGFQTNVQVAGTYVIDPGGDRGTITITSGLHVGTSRFYLTGNSRFVFLNSINAGDTLPLLFTGGCIQYASGSHGGQTCK
jgi:hypothetical protein